MPAREIPHIRIPPALPLPVPDGSGAVEDETLPTSFGSDVEKRVRGSDSAVTDRTEADDPMEELAVKPAKTDSLKVPGANLYYEVRGSGPVLLLVCGGIYDAAGYAGLAGPLADRKSVV